MNHSNLTAIYFILVLLICGSAPLDGKDKTIPDVNLNLNKDNFDVKFYFLDLNVSDSSTYLQGSVTIILEPVEVPLQQVTFDLSNKLLTDSILVNGKKVNYTHTLNELVINLAEPVTAGDNISTQIFYHGLGQYSGLTPGIYNKFSSSWNKRITWTLSEPFSALNWFPCKQSLTDKADSVYVFLSTDNDLKAGSNGLLTAQVPLEDNRIRYEWKSSFPISYYLISFAVSDYRDYSFYVKVDNASDSILVQNYIYNNDDYFEQNKQAIDKTGDMILLYADLFGSYPFENEKYGHCVAPLGGGMEHQTMTTLVNFSFLLVAHELAHQWFGDYVTCSSWQDIWINEGFASYAEYLANQYLKSQETADSWIAGIHNYIKTDPYGSVYIPEKFATDEDRIFDYRLTYNKGAAIIHMIRQEVGNDELFFTILSGFIQKYKNSNASGMDFKNYLEEKTGKDFDQFFNQWYFGEGYPSHTISWNYRQDTLFISSLQTVSSSVTPFFNVLVDFKINHNNKDTLISLRQTNTFSEWKVYLPGTADIVTIDPNRWLLFEVTDIYNTINDVPETRFKIVPNPAREKVNIYFDSQVGKYLLYLADSTGKILYSQESASQHIVIDLDNYPEGMYFIIIKEGNVIRHAKFIIRKG